jgi:hypothetical protein
MLALVVDWPSPERDLARFAMFTSITALVLWSIVRGRGKHELHYLAAIAYVAATVVLG